jgi:phosphoribosylaminoimidazole-succinocarboxamide synthase
MLSSGTQTATAVVKTALPLPIHARGKVRDVYALEPYLLIVATDRLSAYDHVLPTPIPDKGKVLTQLSAFWFDQVHDVMNHHMVATDLETITPRVPKPMRDQLAGLQGRLMLVRKAARLNVECVVRGYLAGSAWEEYRSTGTVTGLTLPAGLTNGAQLPEPIFTPATKAATGHDENITFGRMETIVGMSAASTIREVSTRLYARAAAYARSRGLLLADTKFEFGLLNGSLILIDEALTPDSSRYWDAAAYPHELVAYDKQYVRDYLTQCGWDRASAPPALPAEVVDATRARYVETYLRLTGRKLDDPNDR